MFKKNSHFSIKLIRKTHIKKAIRKREINSITTVHIAKSNTPCVQKITPLLAPIPTNIASNNERFHTHPKDENRRTIEQPTRRQRYLQSVSKWNRFFKLSAANLHSLRPFDALLVSKILPQIKMFRINFFFFSVITSSNYRVSGEIIFLYNLPLLP